MSLFSRADAQDLGSTIGLGVDLTNPFSGLDVTQHDSKVGFMIGLNVALIAITVLVISARIFTRLKFVHDTFKDDLLIVFAGLCTVAFSAMCIVGTKSGLGRHEWDLNLSEIFDLNKEIVKILFVCQVLYATAITFTKLSIIVLYLCIFPNRRLHLCMYFTGTITLMLWPCSVFVTIFQCSPVRAAWDFTIQDRRCIRIQDYFYVASSINIATDLLLCAAPLPLFWKLRISQKERIILCMLFGVGLFATAASVVRLTQLHQLGSIDVSYTSVSSLNWSVIEVVSGIFCASLSTLKPLVKRLFPEAWFTVLTHNGGSRSRHKATRANAPTSTASLADHDNGDAEFKMTTPLAGRALSPYDTTSTNEKQQVVINDQIQPPRSSHSHQSRTSRIGFAM